MCNELLDFVDFYENILQLQGLFRDVMEIFPLKIKENTSRIQTPWKIHLEFLCQKVHTFNPTLPGPYIEVIQFLDEKMA